MSTPAPLPRASLERWQPMRCGLVNIFKFDDQQFRFENGRLLLRGNNGTGKSRVLALTLPFLFDGQTSPHRVEPDRDSNKRMSWNLLMDNHDDRIGYTWLEMGRRGNDDESHAEHFKTIGCGMRAVRGQSGVKTWFFVTDQRIGTDLSLCRNHTPLSRMGLIEAVGEHGRVIDTAEEYRKAIDAAFFGLGPQRYEAMLRLLVELRRPQLSRTLNEADLSRALSEALPPLDDKVVADVANAMSALEKDRQDLDDFISAQAGIDVFLNTYRQYARIAARRSAAPVREKHAAYEKAARALHQADIDSAEANERFDQSERSLESLNKRLTQLDTRVQTLDASPAMRSLENMQASEKQWQDASKQLLADQAEQQNAKDESDRRQRDHTDARDAFDKQRDATVEVATQAQQQAEYASLGDAHRQSADRLGLPAPPDTESLRRVGQAMTQSAERQKRSIKHLQKHNQTVQQLAEASLQAKRNHDEKLARVQTLIQETRDAGRSIENRLTETIDRYSAWCAGLEQLAPADTDPIDEQLCAWVAQAEAEPAGRSPLISAVDDAMRRFQYEHARSTAETQRQRDSTRIDLDEILAAIKVLEDGTHTPPPRPHTRPDGVRADRSGAPLWRLVDFRPSIDDETQCGVEAALESAGLLDAWLMPDGKLIGHTQDTFVLPHHAEPPDRDNDKAATLGRILAPAEDMPEGVSRSIVVAVLHAIGWGEQSDAETWVDPAGRWRNGPLVGRWSKQAVQHIGQSAREAERQRRLAEHRDRATALSTALEEADHRLAQLQEDKATAEQERDAAPTDDPIRQAMSQLFTLQKQMVDARDQASDAEQALIQADLQRSKAERKRDTDAQELGLTAWLFRLDELAQHLADYQLSVKELTHYCDRLFAQSVQADRAKQEHETAKQKLIHWTDRLANAEDLATSAKEKFEVLEQTVGTDAEQVRQEYRQAKEQLAGVKQSIKGAQTEKDEAIAKRSTAQAKREQAEQEHADKQDSRDQSIVSLHRFVERGFLLLADPATDSQVDTASDWSATRGVEVARRIDAAFSKQPMSDEAWRRSKIDLHTGLEQLKETLGPKGYPPRNEPTADDLYRIVVTYQNQPKSVVELNSLLGDEIAHRQGLLDAREKEVIENHLIDEVAVHLHGLIQDAEQLVARMNQQLKGRTMSTGMELRFKWSIATDADDRLTAARRQLQQSPDAQNPEQRNALATFLQYQIRQTQENNDLLAWHECLAKALDYRSWHLFGVERRSALGAPWQALTKRTHGTGSGGEKAIALTIPQFAAASAHYQSASPLAPRLIMLDEAFVGVDPDMRSKCMSLLAEFGLDLVMTSESEWGCYPGLDGNAIYQLATRQGMDAILCTRWVWNGQRKTQDKENDRPHDSDVPLKNSQAPLYVDADVS